MSGTRASLRNVGVGVGASWIGVPRAGTTLTSEIAVTAIIAELRAATKTKKNIDPALVVGSFASAHPGGGQFAFGDGRVSFLGGSAGPKVMRLLAHRADGMLLDEDSF
jgi:prepilin-type processing-associated H-X9-DG protein